MRLKKMMQRSNLVVPSQNGNYGILNRERIALTAP